MPEPRATVTLDLPGLLVDHLQQAGDVAVREALNGPHALTPSERRAADLAGAGLTNREIAQQLCVTIRTVELHLSNVYRKLGVTARAQLLSALTPEAIEARD